MARFRGRVLVPSERWRHACRSHSKSSLNPLKESHVDRLYELDQLDELNDHCHIFLQRGRTMVSPKSKSGMRNSGDWQVKSAAGPKAAKTSIAVTGPAMPKGDVGFKLKVSADASKALAVNPARVTELLQQYGDAITTSRKTGRMVRLRVDVSPEGLTLLSQVHFVVDDPPKAEEFGPSDPTLEGALAAARQRGRIRAGEILSGEDMLNAEAFASLLGTTRATVNAKRQIGQVLGLDGPKRGFRFPNWQLDPDGKPYDAIRGLHERLGGAWAVYRFLVQTHGELDGLTGRQALEQGKAKTALAAAESVGRE